MTLEDKTFKISTYKHMNVPHLFNILHVLNQVLLFFFFFSFFVGRKGVKVTLTLIVKIVPALLVEKNLRFPSTNRHFVEPKTF
jgi:hypothetical protein